MPDNTDVTHAVLDEALEHAKQRKREYLASYNTDDFIAAAKSLGFSDEMIKLFQDEARRMLEEEEGVRGHA